MAHRGGLLASYLEAVGEGVSKLSLGAGRVSPPVSLVSLAIFASVASFIDPLPLRPTSLIPLLLSGILALASGTLREFSALALFTLGLVVPVALPLLMMTPGRALCCLSCVCITLEGLYEFSNFVFRCTNASVLTLSWILYAGFDSIIEGLRVLDPTGTVPKLAQMTIRYIPLSARELARIVAAREARLLDRKLARVWRVSATCYGDALLRCFERAKRVSLAISARDLGSKHVDPARSKAKFADALWIFAALGYAIGVLIGV